jgi:hypothetical protein
MQRSGEEEVNSGFDFVKNKTLTKNKYWAVVTFLTLRKTHTHRAYNKIIG